MQAAVRPFVTAGIALVGASTIAVTPSTPAPAPDIRIADLAVQLTAAPSPIFFYLDTFIYSASANVDILARQYLDEPLPIIRAILGSKIIAPSVFGDSLISVSEALSMVGVHISYRG